jgi:hypothetical protein
MTAHYFDSSGEAYDACQCDETIQNGDVLVIASERIVGLAHTWPVTVTADHGALHKLNSGWTLTEGHEAFLESQVLEAVAIANALGLPLASYAQGYAA